MDKILQSQLLTYAVAFVFILLAILLFIYVARQLFGRRIRAPGPRNRPRRLDIVDAFDLDRERQLIIVRRDNIEHLLLIGGPNDVLVEVISEAKRDNYADHIELLSRSLEPWILK